MAAFAAFKKWWLLVVLLSVFVCFFGFHLYEYLSFSAIKHYQVDAQSWTAHHYTQAVLIYLLSFIVLIACAIPCATIFTLIGGFLFGAIAILYSIFSITLGGMILLLAVRSALGIRISANSAGIIKKMEQGFRRNAFNYLLMLRLIPIFPCWISNISAGVLNVPLKTFVSATILGLIPSTFVYVAAGHGLETFFTADDTFKVKLLFSPSILLPLTGLILLSLLPIFYSWFKKSEPGDAK